MELTAAGAVTAFAGGVISFLSPCVLPLVPGYLSYVAGQPGAGAEPDRRAALRLSLFFVLGFSTVFVLLGAGASYLSRMLLSYRYEAAIAGGVLVFLFGLLMTGLVRIPILDRDARWHGAVRGGTPGGAYLIGLAFAFGWTPCIGPILGSILMLTSAGLSGDGILLLALYSAGLGLPFILVTLTMARFMGRMRTLRHVGRWLQIAAGAGMMFMGAAMITGRLEEIALFFLRTFPFLGRIG